MPKESRELQTMADLLKQGATLTDLSCPACASPIFKLKSGEFWCAKCQKRVILVKEGQTPEEATRPILLSTLETTVLTKIQEIEKRIKEEEDPEQLQKLTTILSNLLDELNKIRKMK